MASQHQHPEPSRLEAFALGRLGTAELETIEAHLGGCPSCGRRVQEVPDDSLVRLLRRPPAPEEVDSRPPGRGRVSRPAGGARR